MGPDLVVDRSVGTHFFVQNLRVGDLVAIEGVVFERAEEPLDGGGLIRVTAATIHVEGTITAGGAPGEDSPGLLAGGGGSGGSVWLTADSIALENTNAINVSGGAGGAGGGVNSGGAGAPGRVRLDAAQVTGAGANDAAWGSSYGTTVTPLITSYSYDAAHRLVDTVLGADNEDAAQAGLVDANGGSNVRTRLAYDADGHVAGSFEPRAFQTSTTTPDARYMTRVDFDADGRPTDTYVPRYGGSASDLGLSATQTDECPTSGVSPQTLSGIPGYPSGTGICVTRVAYDPAGNKTRVTLPTATGSSGNRFVDYTYTDDNLVASVTPPSPVDGNHSSSAATSFLYDGVSRTVKSKAPLARQSTTEYFADGRVDRVTAMPNGLITHVTSFGYDANGNTRSATDPMGNTSTTTFFADNTLKDASDPLANKTSYAYDAAGNPTQVFSPSANAQESNNSAGVPVTYTYTFDNLLKTATTPVAPNGSVRRQVTYSYDRSSRKIAQTTDKVDASGDALAAGGTQSFAYYANDRLASETGRTGSPTTYRYDAAGNPTTLTDPSGSTLAATYYLDGLPRSVDDGSRTNQYVYNGSGFPSGRADLVNGNATKFTTTYGHNDAGLPISMSSNVPGSSASDFKTTTWTWDQAGRPATENAPSGASVAWGFDPDDTLASFQVKDGATDLASWTYTYDKNYRQTDQNLVAAQGGSGGSLVTGSFQYTYDAAGRISSFKQGAATPKTLDWDRDGNRLRYGTDDFAYNADDSIRVAEPGESDEKVYSYEPFGGLKSDGCTNYEYDGFDRLAQAAGQAGSGCPAPEAPTTYLYDALDRQRSRDDGTGATAIHYDGLNNGTAVETKSNGIDTFFEIGPTGTPKALKVNGATPTIEYLNHDGHGNVTLVTTASASVKCTVRYDPFGAPVSPQGENPCSSGSEPANDLFYRSGRRDAVTGTYQMGSRTYDPGKASFLTPDSYRNQQPGADLSVGVDPLTRNTYSYVNGDPVNLIDPTGHKFMAGDGGISEREFQWRTYQQWLSQQPGTLAIDLGNQHLYLTPDQSKQLNAKLGGDSRCGVDAYGGGQTVWNAAAKSCGVWIEDHRHTFVQDALDSTVTFYNRLSFGGLRGALELLPGDQEAKVDWDSPAAKQGDFLASVAEKIIIAKAVTSASMALFEKAAAKLAARAATRGAAKQTTQVRSLIDDAFQAGAPQTADDFVDLASATRRRHILQGEVLPGGRYSGGHRAGTGFPNKSEFPASWSDDQIMHHISDVATDPALTWRLGRGGDFWVSGTREGMDIEVLIRNNEIWTAYPTNLPRNPL